MNTMTKLNNMTKDTLVAGLDRSFDPTPVVSLEHVRMVKMGGRWQFAVDIFTVLSALRHDLGWKEDENGELLEDYDIIPQLAHLKHPQAFSIHTAAQVLPELLAMDYETFENSMALVTGPGGEITTVLSVALAVNLIDWYLGGDFYDVFAEKDSYEAHTLYMELYAVLSTLYDYRDQCVAGFINNHIEAALNGAADTDDEEPEIEEYDEDDDDDDDDVLTMADAVEITTAKLVTEGYGIVSFDYVANELSPIHDDWVGIQALEAAGFEPWRNGAGVQMNTGKEVKNIWFHRKRCGGVEPVVAQIWIALDTSFDCYVDE